MSESQRMSEMSEVSEQSKESFGFMAHLHRCRKCNRFFRGCRCSRRMYKRYRRSCVCKSVLSLLVCALSAWILYKVAMYIYNSPMLQNITQK